MPRPVHRPAAPPFKVGGDYHHAGVDAFVTVVDIEVRSGRRTGRLLVRRADARVPLPFACQERDLRVGADDPRPVDAAPTRARRSTP